MTELIWQSARRRFKLNERALILGVLNVTPDSFSDGGRYQDLESALSQAEAMIRDGADILDIGGESSRPGAQPVPVAEELRRVLPLVGVLTKHFDIPLSIDTTKAEVAEACLAAGASIINDISGLRADPKMLAVVGQSQAGVIVMHMRGTPATMQQQTDYDDVVGELHAFFVERLSTLTQAGIDERAIALDPGIGFGKTASQNLQLIGELGSLEDLGRPVCLGVSRKSFLGTILDRPIEDRLHGSLAAMSHALAKRTAQLVRVHDVAASRDYVELHAAIHRQCGYT